MTGADGIATVEDSVVVVVEIAACVEAVRWWSALCFTLTAAEWHALWLHCDRRGQVSPG